MKTPFQIEPTDGLITVTAAYTPSTHTHDPESMYFRYYWLPETGPSAYLAFLLLNAWLPGDDEALHHYRLRRVCSHDRHNPRTHHPNPRPPRRLPPRPHTPRPTINPLPTTTSTDPYDQTTRTTRHTLPNPRRLTRRTPTRRLTALCFEESPATAGDFCASVIPPTAGRSAAAEPKRRDDTCKDRKHYGHDWHSWSGTLNTCGG